MDMDFYSVMKVNGDGKMRDALVIPVRLHDTADREPTWGGKMRDALVIYGME